MKPLSQDVYRKWLGYSFERWCRRNDFRIADALGFGSIKYSSGPFFNRNSKNKNFQIDLLFDRADKVISLCEIKYHTKPVSTEVIDDFEEKLRILREITNKTIHRVLISASGATKSLIDKNYFDSIIDLKDILE